MNLEIFKAYDIRGEVGKDLNAEVAEVVGRAFADWLPADGKIAVGCDMRPDSADLAAALINGLTKQGRDVIDIGLITSDMVFFAVGKWNLAGGAVITGSHNPGKENGIKLYRDQVIAVGLDSGLDEIRDAAVVNKFKTAKRTGKVEKGSILNEWVEHCLTFAPNLKPFRIAIDNGNGAAGTVLPHILPKLPISAEVMYPEPDGTFPNHGANPSLVENLQDLIAKVKSDKLDFGIAFDGDGDRVVFVDDLGRPVPGTDIISIGAKHYLDKYPDGIVVHEVRTSRATKELIRKWGGTPVCTKAGRVVVGSEMRKLGAIFGGETSGHIFFKENYYADSGLIAALVIMQAISDSGRKLSELADEYRLYKMIPETNFKVSRGKEEIFARLRKEFADAKIEEIDGITAEYPYGWFNARASNTEPLIRLNAEAIDEAKLDELVAKAQAVITS